MCGASDNGDGAVDRTVTSTTETMPSRVGRETSIVLAQLHEVGEGFMTMGEGMETPRSKCTSRGGVPLYCVIIYGDTGNWWRVFRIKGSVNHNRSWKTRDRAHKIQSLTSTESHSP